MKYKIFDKRGILRKFWHFFIVEPQCSIVGEKSVYLNVGSSHTINCTVASPQPPDHIFWYFNHRPLPVTSHGHPGHSGEAGDWTVTSLMAPDISWSQVTPGHRPSCVSTDHAQVVLASVQVEHSGLYECRPSNCDSDTVSLVILDGENIQTRGAIINIQGEKSNATGFWLPGPAFGNKPAFLSRKDNKVLLVGD